MSLESRDSGGIYQCAYLFASCCLGANGVAAKLVSCYPPTSASVPLNNSDGILRNEADGERKGTEHEAPTLR
jgi:hypothetical protein